jgi:hypothetical protein
VLLSKGVHVKLVQELLGHSTIAVTLDTYSHMLPGMGEGIANTMDEVLSSRVAVKGSWCDAGIPLSSWCLYCVLPANRRKSGEGGIRTHETAQHRLHDFQSQKDTLPVSCSASQSIPMRPFGLAACGFSPSTKNSLARPQLMHMLEGSRSALRILS